jgi:isochorismate hydrolase
MLRFQQVRGANILGLPIIVTEQYPKAFGPTVSELSDPAVLSPSTPIIAKTKFSMWTSEVEALMAKTPSVKQILLCGIETHVCVLQTTLDLLERGYEVHLLTDGLSSCRAHDRTVALNRMAQAGALLSTSEMSLFQLMGDAKNSNFKAVSALIKEPRSDPIPFTSSL